MSIYTATFRNLQFGDTILFFGIQFHELHIACESIQSFWLLFHMTRAQKIAQAGYMYLNYQFIEFKLIICMFNYLFMFGRTKKICKSSSFHPPPPFIISCCPKFPFKTLYDLKEHGKCLLFLNCDTLNIFKEKIVKGLFLSRQNICDTYSIIFLVKFFTIKY